jgi:acyl-coenzyme A synthetase/AMP-(fatty) acid ligase
VVTTAHLDNEILTRELRGTWADLQPRQLPPVAAVLVSTHTQALAAVRAHLDEGGELLLVSRNRADQELRYELRRDGFALVEDGATTRPLTTRTPEPGRIWLTTSGSTGRAKRVGHRLESLATVRSRQPRRRWLCAYSPGTYAWWQLVTLVLLHPDQGLVCVEMDSIDTWPDLAFEEQVTAASGTPTFWRHGLLRGAPRLADTPFEQVTLGGEPVDQPILDGLRALLPAARISWIYASTEAGAAIAVHDGRAGFPIEWLDRRGRDRARLTVEGGELLIESAHHAAGYDGPVRTGDHAEIIDGRVHVTGRIGSDEINVGGAKIAASAVQRVLLAHPNVVWANVAPRRAPLVGRVVAADVVLDASVSERDLLAWCTARLPDYGVPRRLRQLDEIPLTETLKSHV